MQPDGPAAARGRPLPRHRVLAPLAHRLGRHAPGCRGGAVDGAYQEDSGQPRRAGAPGGGPQRLFEPHPQPHDQALGRRRPVHRGR
uniref:Uncharacterized protein n=1 Tax=Mycolicibacterium phage phi1_186018 TaxID=3236641 RepID=A0AB39AKH9_9CAUD